MKLIILLFCCTVISFCSFAQGIQALPDSNVYWLMEVYSGGPQPNDKWAYYVNSDTTINSISYNKLYATCPQLGQPPINSGWYIGAYRNDTVGRLYYVPKDTILEYRLYDFSKNAGDTINDLYYSTVPIYCSGDLFDQVMNILIDSVGYDTLGGKAYKKIYFAGNVWMQGVGSPVVGFFPHYDGFSYNYDLYCMSYNDTTYYRGHLGYIYDYTYSYGICDTLLLLGVTEPEQKCIRIFPAIVSTSIHISNDCSFQFQKIRILNSLGVTCLEIFNTEDNSIDLTSLASGMYYVQIFANNRFYSQKIIKL